MRVQKRNPDPKPRPKSKAKPAPRSKKPSTLHGIKLTAPIFRTALAGKVSKYERPFDLVWPADEDTDK